jgi:hypothetical protein
MTNITPPPPILPSQVIVTHSPQQPAQTTPQIREAVKSTHSNEKTNPDKKQKKTPEQKQHDEQEHIVDLEI